MPPPEVYEAEYDFWPWGRLLNSLAEWVVCEAPQQAVVVDYMCGTGRLLHLVSQKRPDLKLFGCDISKEYVNYGQAKYGRVHLEVADALTHQPSEKPDMIICAAGIHHLSPPNQSIFVRKAAKELTVGGLFIVGEEVVRGWSDERDRRGAVLELSVALLDDLIANSAPDEQIEAAVGMLKRDLFQIGEFKSSLDEMLTLLRSRFCIKRLVHVWPADGRPFGDYLLCANPGNQQTL